MDQSNSIIKTREISDSEEISDYVINNNNQINNNLTNDITLNNNKDIDDDDDDDVGGEEFDFSSSDFNESPNEDVDDVFDKQIEKKTDSNNVNNINSINNSNTGIIIESTNNQLISDLLDSSEFGKQSLDNPNLITETINLTCVNEELLKSTESPFESQIIKDTTSEHQSQYQDNLPISEDEGIIVNYLGKSNEIAEARLAQRRQARAEAREIRMRELERQQKEQEQNADRVFDMQTAAGIDPIARTRLNISGTVGNTSLIRGVNSMSSRRSSEDSLEEEGRSLRDVRHELKDVEERFRKAMIANAQLDNERASQSYQIQNIKDKLEEMEENQAQLHREYKDKCHDHDVLKRNNDKLSEELKLVQGQLNERDTLITEYGLTIVIVENADGTDAKRALVSADNVQLLDSVQGSLDVRLKKFAEEKQSMKNEIQQLHQQIIDLRTQRRSGSQNGPLGEDDFEDAQREANKTIADHKFKLQKADQEIASLQASLARSETQVIRYKSTADAAEKSESELKIERRKLQRENREILERLEELETSNNHLLKRLDKLKNAKSALLKDL